MPAKDIYHDCVKNALIKDSWTITHDPLSLKWGKKDMYVDLGAEQLLAAEKAEHKIAVEIKSFLGASAISEFHTALGQFMNYRLALRQEEPDRILYLAVPSDTYDSFFNLQFIQLAIQQYQLKIIVYNSVDEVIVKWQK